MNDINSINCGQGAILNLKLSSAKSRGHPQRINAKGAIGPIF